MFRYQVTTRSAAKTRWSSWPHERSAPTRRTRTPAGRAAGVGAPGRRATVTSSPARTSWAMTVSGRLTSAPFRRWRTAAIRDQGAPALPDEVGDALEADRDDGVPVGV